MSVKEFSESAKGFTKSPLGIIALFIVLVYGFASLVVGFGQNVSSHITPLIYFMVIFPGVVFLDFFGWSLIIIINCMAHRISKMRKTF